MTVLGLAFAIFLGLLAERWVTEGIKTLVYMYAARKYKEELKYQMDNLLRREALEDTTTPLSLN